MQTTGSDSQREPTSMSSDEMPIGEWVELALEAPNGDELGRMLRHSQPEEEAWRRIHAADHRGRGLTAESPD
jgi:hypothetical protein